MSGFGIFFVRLLQSLGVDAEGCKIRHEAGLGRSGLFFVIFASFGAGDGIQTGKA